MKLASLKCSNPDGAFIVVCRALCRAGSAVNIAPTMRAVLDNWTGAYPALKALYEVVNRTEAPGASEFEPCDVTWIPRASDPGSHTSQTFPARSGSSRQMDVMSSTTPIPRSSTSSPVPASRALAPANC